LVFTHKQLGLFDQLDKVVQLPNLLFCKIPVPKRA
jgi:hypothetical protein